MEHLPPLLVVVPILAAAVLRLVVAATAERVARLLATLASVAVAAMAAAVLFGTGPEPVVHWVGGWEPVDGRALGVALVADRFAAGMVLLAAVLVASGFVFVSRAYETLGALYHTLTLLFLAGLNGFVLSGDLFTMFVFLELMSIPAYVLTAYNVDSTGPLQGTLNFAVTNTIGTVGFLLGAGMLYALGGTPNLAELAGVLATQGADPVVVSALTLMTAGMFAKAALVPFHFWHADAHAVAPSPICVLFGAVLIQVGLLAAVRLHWTAFGSVVDAARSSLRPVLVAVGVVTAVVTAVMCLLQQHLKRLLAFSSVAHVGIAAVGAGLLDAGALGGAGVYVLSHGGVKAALFLSVGVILLRLGSVDERELNGRGGSLWPLGVVMILGGLALAGLPGFGTASGKAAIHDAASSLGWGWLGVVIYGAAAITGAAVIRASLAVVWGIGGAQPTPGDEVAAVAEDETATVSDVRMRAGLWAPIVALMVAAAAPAWSRPVLEGATDAAVRFVDPDAYAASVLGGAPGPSARTDGPSDDPTGVPLFGAAWGFAAAGVAAGVGLLAAGGRPRSRWFAPVELVARGLRSVHSGHPADYVTWLTIGVTGLGAAFWVAVG